MRVGFFVRLVRDTKVCHSTIVPIYQSEISPPNHVNAQISLCMSPIHDFFFLIREVP